MSADKRENPERLIGVTTDKGDSGPEPDAPSDKTFKTSSETEPKLETDDKYSENDSVSGRLTDSAFHKI